MKVEEAGLITQMVAERGFYGGISTEPSNFITAM